MSNFWPNFWTFPTGVFYWPRGRNFGLPEPVNIFAGSNIYRDYAADTLVIVIFALLFIPIVVVGLFRLIAAKNKRDFIKSITATQVPYPKQSRSIQHEPMKQD